MTTKERNRKRKSAYTIAKYSRFEVGAKRLDKIESFSLRPVRHVAMVKENPTEFEVTVDSDSLRRYVADTKELGKKYRTVRA